MRNIFLLATGLSFAIAAQAQAVPDSALFVGLGASYNSVDFESPHNYSQGVSNVYDAQTGDLVSVGSAGGSTNVSLDTQSTSAPVLHGGYFQHFSGSNWLWGAKFSYSYLNKTATNKNVLIPQAGSFTDITDQTPTAFTGNVLVHSYQASIKHQLTLIPFIGHSFEQSILYFGAGPTLTQTETELTDTIGFADIDGGHTNITGLPTSISSTQWLYGGAAVVGATYFFDPSWFLDASYTYAVTQNKTTDYSESFVNTSDGYETVGVLSGDYSGRVTTQALTVSINKSF